MKKSKTQLEQRRIVSVIEPRRITHEMIYDEGKPDEYREDVVLCCLIEVTEPNGHRYSLVAPLVVGGTSSTERALEEEDVSNMVLRLKKEFAKP